MVKEPLPEGCFKLKSDDVLVLFRESRGFDVIVHAVDVLAKFLKVYVGVI